MERLAQAFTLFLVLAVAVPNDNLKLSAVQRLSASYQYNLITWEVSSFPEKWLHWLGNALFPVHPTLERRSAAVREYFQLKREAATIQEKLDLGVATAPDAHKQMERRLDTLRLQSDRLRPQVEEMLEAAVTQVLREQGIPIGIGKIIFPPVDFSLDPLPTLLIISPRQRIELKESILLVPRIPEQTREALENRIAGEQDLSALVEGIGGISTYPSIVHSGDLRGTLITASHEWLHNYLFFRALGQNYYREANMASLNETTANIFGEELGNLAFARLTGEAPAQRGPGSAGEPCPQTSFCFREEMRETRLRVDQLLAEGGVVEAEAYMEARRQVFVEHGYVIRKLNQAYFAYHGTYADSPASVSPIYEQLRQVRQASTSLGAFIKTMAGVASYKEFTTLLDRLHAGQ